MTRGVFTTPAELAGVGFVGDGHCGAEAPCPQCGATDRTAETDFYGGARLRCVTCRHIEPVVRRAAPPVPEPVVPDVLAHLTAEAVERERMDRRIRGHYRSNPARDAAHLALVPTEWTPRARVLALLGLERAGWERMEERLMRAGHVERDTCVGVNERGQRRRVTMLRRVIP